MIFCLVVTAVRAPHVAADISKFPGEARTSFSQSPPELAKSDRHHSVLVYSACCAACPYDISKNSVGAAVLFASFHQLQIALVFVRVF